MPEKHTTPINMKIELLVLGDVSIFSYMSETCAIQIKLTEAFESL